MIGGASPPVDAATDFLLYWEISTCESFTDLLKFYELEAGFGYLWNVRQDIEFPLGNYIIYLLFLTSFKLYTTILP